MMPEHGLEQPFKNDTGAPITDILSEIRQLISSEADERYSREREVARTELLILRPESRVDLLLQEPEQMIVVDEAPRRVEEIQQPPPVSHIKPNKMEMPSRQALRSLIREIVLEELAREKALDRTA